MNRLEEKKQLQLDFAKLKKATDACPAIVPVVVQNIDTREVILLASTNEEAFLKSMQERRLILWSTSRDELWEKGSTSGNKFALIEAYVNCEQNSLLYRVRPLRESICHTKNRKGKPRNCFYRRIDPANLTLENLDP